MNMCSKLKFAMVSACEFTGPYSGAIHGDFWNMYYWMRLFETNYHYNFATLGQNYQELDKYDIVMFSGHPNYLENIMYLADKTKATTIFFPEGDVSLYHENNFGGIQEKVFQVWNSCSIFGIVEEDKQHFYESLVHRPVRFLHTPVPEFLINGAVFTGPYIKGNDILIYGDNNPNNPIVALAVAKKMNLPVAITQMTESEVNCIRNYLGITVSRCYKKLDQFTYLRNWVAMSRVIIYPTRWIGTNRQVISGALCGTPVIGNRDSHTQKRLFPMLGIYNYNTETICSLVDRLYNDMIYYDECCRYAKEAVTFYSEANALQRILKAYDEVKRC